jgi:TP53 regulating kinase-like protein
MRKKNSQNQYFYDFDAPMKIIAQGAEAIIYEENEVIVKERLNKAYRIKELDLKIVKTRTRKEAKILKFLNEKNLNVPKLIKTDGNKIYMSKIDGKSLKSELIGDETANNDAFVSNELPINLEDLNMKDTIKLDFYEIMTETGKLVASLHNLGVVHGDLTTLNFMISKNLIYLIDFGLSFNSSKDEDKAVDLYVFERAIHCGHKDEYLIPFYEGYSNVGSEKVLKKLESVRLRGRKREEEAL